MPMEEPRAIIVTWRLLNLRCSSLSAPWSTMSPVWTSWSWDGLDEGIAAFSALYSSLVPMVGFFVFDDAFLSNLLKPLPEDS